MTSFCPKMLLMILLSSLEVDGKARVETLAATNFNTGLTRRWSN